MDSNTRTQAWRWSAFWIAFAFVVRTLIALLVPLLPDETYYWEWTRHLAAGYYDHPPGIALLIRAGTAAFGNTTLGVRAGPAAAALVMHISLVLLASRVGTARDGTRAAILVALLPLATIGLVLATPDVLLLAFASVALLCLERALAAPVRSLPSLRWWLCTGVALGAAFDSKYTAILLPASLVVACLIYAPLRLRLVEPGPWLASAIAVICFLPVLRWNASADFISFRFQLNHGLGTTARGTPLGRELDMIGGQLGLATPIIASLMIGALALTLSREWKRRRTVATPAVASTRFAFAAISAFIFLFFAFSAWRRSVEANWPGLAYPAAIVVLATTPDAWARARWWRAGIWFAAAVLLLALLQIARPVLPLAPKKDPIGRAYGWDTLADAVQLAQRDTFLKTTNQRWVAAERYQDASELAFHLADQPQTFSLNLNSRRNQYDLWAAPANLIRPDDALIVAFDATPQGDASAGTVATWFAESKRGPTVQMRRGDGVVGERTIWLFKFAQNIPPLKTALIPSPR
ncbi:MAG: glycosyltransferase family 39 protein [Gemmatimonadota bacterium]|nr:glycosyltransferase family 39 protein [Gemmatimonadota bacterium]